MKPKNVGAREGEWEGITAISSKDSKDSNAQQGASGSNIGCNDGALCVNSLTNTGTITNSKDSDVQQGATGTSSCSSGASCDNTLSNAAAISQSSLCKVLQESHASSSYSGSTANCTNSGSQSASIS